MPHSASWVMSRLCLACRGLHGVHQITGPRQCALIFADRRTGRAPGPPAEGPDRREEPDLGVRPAGRQRQPQPARTAAERSSAALFAAPGVSPLPTKEKTSSRPSASTTYPLSAMTVFERARLGAHQPGARGRGRIRVAVPQGAGEPGDREPARAARSRGSVPEVMARTTSVSCRAETLVGQGQAGDVRGPERVSGNAHVPDLLQHGGNGVVAAAGPADAEGGHPSHHLGEVVVRGLQHQVHLLPHRGGLDLGQDFGVPALRRVTGRPRATPGPRTAPRPPRPP